MLKSTQSWLSGLMVLFLSASLNGAKAQGFTITNGGNTVKLWGTGYNIDPSTNYGDGTATVEPYWKLVAFPNNYLVTPLGADLYMSSPVPSNWYKTVGSCGTPCLNSPVTVDGDTYRWITYARYPNEFGLNPIGSSNATSYFRGPGTSDPAFPGGQPTTGTPNATNKVINPAQNYNYIIQTRNKFIPTVTGNYQFVSKVTADNRLQAFLSKPNTAIGFLNVGQANVTVDPSTADLLGVSGPENTPGLFSSLSTITNNNVLLEAGKEYEFTYVVTDNYLASGTYGSSGALISATGFTLPVDLSVTITDNTLVYTQGGTLTYVVVVTNNNIPGGANAVSGANLTVTPASGITFGAWTASYSGGGSASGTGNINQTLASLPVGGTVTFTITATVSGSANSNLTTSATVTAPDGIPEINTTNNSAADTDALPLRWGGFTAKSDGADVKLAWSTLMEENTLDFRVQRSQSGQPWSEVGDVQAAGFSQNMRNYNFTDRNVPLGQWQYRLLQRDKGSQSSFSETRSVKVSGVAEMLTVYGNPVTNGQFKFSVRENGNMTIVDNMGRAVYKSDLTPGVHTIQTSQWMKGSYNYRFTGSETVTGRVVLQ
jgi:hypothetical protein